MNKGVFLWLHRWGGLIIGFYFVLLGLSGSYLVYRDEIDLLFKPHLHRSKARAESIDLQSLIAIAKESLSPDAELSRMNIPSDPGRTIAMSFNANPKKGPPSFVTVFVDPSTNEVLGHENLRHTLSGQIFFFHHDLLMGRPGRLIMGVSGLFMLFLLASGVYLWWPKGLFLRGFKLGPMRTAFQKNYELHKLTGIYSLILMIAVTFTGTYLSKPNWFGGGMRRPQKPAQEKPADNTALDPSRLERLLLKSGLPERGLRMRLRSSQAHVQDQQTGRSVTLDLNSGKSKEVSGKSIRQVQHDIHAGHFWGELGRWLVFLSGLIPVFFYISGVFIWWKRRR